MDRCGERPSRFLAGLKHPPNASRAGCFLWNLRLRRKTCPFRSVPDLRDDFRELPDTPPQWVRPTVVEVEYR